MTCSQLMGSDSYENTEDSNSCIIKKIQRKTGRQIFLSPKNRIVSSKKPCDIQSKNKAQEGFGEFKKFMKEGVINIDALGKTMRYLSPKNSKNNNLLYQSFAEPKTLPSTPSTPETPPQPPQPPHPSLTPCPQKCPLPPQQPTLCLLREQNTLLIAQNKSLKKQIDFVNKKNQTLQKCKQVLEENKLSLGNKVEFLSQRVKDLQSQLEQSQNTIKCLQSKCQSLESKCLSFKSKYQSLESEYMSLESEHRALELEMQGKKQWQQSTIKWNILQRLYKRALQQAKQSQFRRQRIQGEFRGFMGKIGYLEDMLHERTREVQKWKFLAKSQGKGWKSEQLDVDDDVSQLQYSICDFSDGLLSSK